MELLITYSDTTEIFMRIIFAVILGMFLGTERIMARKTAGMRTYSLVSMGAAVFVILSMILSELYAGKMSTDPLRVMSQIIVGIGFIGAGLIIFQNSKISGLTTAAGLWVAAGIGIASGYGLYSIAIFVTILTLFIFTAVWYMEQKLKDITEKYGSKHKSMEDDDDF